MDPVAWLQERLNLARPLVFMDVETTGLNPEEDRVVELGILKLHPDGRITDWRSRFDPAPVKVSPSAFEKHGLGDADLFGEPKFQDVAVKVAAGLLNCDLAAFNARRFDLRILQAEMTRARVNWSLDGVRIVDPLAIWARQEPRDLAAALKRFAGIDEPGTHRAGRDTAAVLLVLVGQLMAWPNLTPTVDALHEAGRDANWIDPDGKLRWEAGRACFTFGKHIGKALQDVPRGYLDFILEGNFSPDLKRICQEAKEGRFPSQDSV